MSARFSLRRNNHPPLPPSPSADAVPAGNGSPGGFDDAGVLNDTAYDDTDAYEAVGGRRGGSEVAGGYDEAAEAGYDAELEDLPGGYDSDPTAYPAGGYVDDEDDESWLAPDTRRRVKMAVPTFALAALVVVAGAFWGGAEVDKHFGNHNSTTAAGLAAALGRGAAGLGSGGTRSGGGGFAGLGGGGGAGGFGGGGLGGSTPAASGTLSAVSGDDLTVSSTTGSKVKVVLTSTTIVTRIGQGSAGPLKVGDTVRVQGSKASDGTVTATSVTAIAANVTTGGGFTGLGRSGGGGSPVVVGGGGGLSGKSTTESTVRNGGFSGDGSGVSG